ncbi:hypothetical protein ACO0K0_01525 [Undibacterium sp. SXout11W]|uniref:hypothetical protein n=1 Tax=Undibacterium sp. SXout11W TaxID=3413050 RepID=UPI003BF04C1F
MNFREQLHKARYGTMCNFGGGSDSQANQTSNTETTDNSVIGAPGSTNASFNHSNGNAFSVVNNTTTNNTTTDFGAVHDSFDAIKKITADATTLESHALGAVSSNSIASFAAINKASENALNAVNNENAYALKAVGDAYTTAKAGEQKVLVGVAVAILGIVAIKVMK